MGRSFAVDAARRTPGAETVRVSIVNDATDVKSPTARLLSPGTCTHELLGRERCGR